MSRHQNIMRKMKAAKRARQRQRMADVVSEGSTERPNTGEGKARIPKDVKRFLIPDSSFGRKDRTVAVVPPEFANEADLKTKSVPLEEYLAEQLTYRVVGDLLVLGSGCVTYDDTFGLRVPGSYDRPFSRAADDLTVYSYDGYLAWAEGATDSDLQKYVVPADRPPTPGCSFPPGMEITASGKTMPEYIYVANEGPELMDTDFWNTDRERKGFYHLTANAGTLRLLVPRARECDLSDMKTGKYAIVTSGVNSLSGRPSIEILFEDESDSPFVMYFSPNQADRSLCPQGTPVLERELVVYVNYCKEVLRMKCYLRAGSLPCLKPLS